MTDAEPPGGGDDHDAVRGHGNGIPEAVVAPRSRLLPELVWAVPIVAVLIAGWLAVRAVLSRGPTITISFREAGGLAAGKTKLKYRDVDVGEVRAIGFSPDRATVVVTAELTRDAAPWLVADTRFWVVRARIAAGEVSGLETLLSGPYIGLDVGTSKRGRRDFVGLEIAPVFTAGTPGRPFVVRAVRSIEPGSPVFFRHLEVGRVTASDLEDDGRHVAVGVFVRAPYDRYVTTAARFWEATGVDVTLDTAGLKIETESLAAILLGGISFEPAADDARDAAPAPPGHRFTLFHDRDAAMKQPDTRGEDYTLIFRQSVRGLAVGAPVDFRGMPIGEVTRIAVDYDPVGLDFSTPVDIRIYPGRLRARLRDPSAAVLQQPADLRELRRFVEHGLRAQLRSGNFLTGQLYVALDFFPGTPRVKANVDPARGSPQIPTIPGDFDTLSSSLVGVAKKVDSIPWDDVGAIIGQARGVLATAGSTLDDADLAIKALGGSAPGQAGIEEAIRQVSRAARSVRALAESLERHPESLIRGRKRESR